jgi:hypothetical protein
MYVAFPMRLQLKNTWELTVKGEQIMSLFGDALISGGS